MTVGSPAVNPRAECSCAGSPLPGGRSEWQNAHARYLSSALLYMWRSVVLRRANCILATCYADAQGGLLQVLAVPFLQWDAMEMTGSGAHARGERMDWLVAELRARGIVGPAPDGQPTT